MKTLLLILLLVLPGLAPGQVSDPDLATVRVPVADRGQGLRQDALREALARVLVRMTGQRGAPEHEELESMLRDPNRWLEHYGYGEDEDGELMLEARFALPEITRYLRRAGAPVWGATRPPLLLWLVDERGALVGADLDPDDSLHRTLRERSGGRGLPLQLPDLDELEREEVAAADIRGRFDDRLLRASEGYGLPLLATAVFYPGAEPYVRWRLLQDDGEPLEEGRLRVDPEDGDTTAGLAAALVDRLADEVARHYAVTGTEDVRVPLRVEGLTSLADYAAFRAHTGDLAGVEDLAIRQLDGGVISAEVSFRGSPERLERLMRLHRQLGPCETPDMRVGTHVPEENAGLRFCWRRDPE